jgi:hypothetical protein
VSGNFGIPYECGLGDLQAKEIQAEWYQRLPFSLEVAWTVRTRHPWAGGVWQIGYLLIFDSEGRVQSKGLASPPVLRGPIKPPPLTNEARAYRVAHGIPLKDDPYRGDSLTLSTNLLVGDPLP